MGGTGQIVIYFRKSKFTGKGESIENQIEMCRQYIRIHFGETAARNALVYEDEGFSGDGRTKKACKLKLIPEEIGVVKLIFDKFIETSSLTNQPHGGMDRLCR